MMQTHKTIVTVQTLSEICKFSWTSMDAEVQRYLFQRGLSQKSIDQFRVGYFPIKMTQLLHSVQPQLLRQQGIIYDVHLGPLQNRIIFPIYDQYDTLITVTGRRFDKRELELQHYVGVDFSKILRSKQQRVKYWHPSYDKGRFLYGLVHAIQSIRQTNYVFVGEGPLDIILAHQCGITNAVAATGTILTFEQISLLSRYAANIILVFDSDKAGIKAVQRVIKKAPMRYGVALSYIILPCGYDWHEFLIKQGRQAFDQLLQYRYTVE